MDWAGMGLLAIALTCLVMVTTWGGATYGWGSPQIVSLIAVTVVAGVAVRPAWNGAQQSR